MPKPRCHKHDVELICPICRGSRGGKTTAKKYSSKKLSEWGKLGGRPRKKKPDQPKPDKPGPKDNAQIA